jgi:hypothetical protein
MSKDSQNNWPREQSLQSKTQTGESKGKIIKFERPNRIAARTDSASTKKILEHAKSLKW